MMVDPIKIAEEAHKILSTKEYKIMLGGLKLELKDIILVANAFEQARRKLEKEEALELTQRFAHELPGVVDWPETR